MKRMLINATQPDEVRVAITDDSKLIDLDIEIPGQEQKNPIFTKASLPALSQVSVRCLLIMAANATGFAAERNLPGIFSPGHRRRF